MKLTIAVITKNSSLDKLFLKSLSLADEVVVIVDSLIKSPSKKGKINYYYHPLSQEFSAQRNFALDKSHGEWVLFVDDDEIISSELMREIRQNIDQTKFSGFLITRKDVCFHQVLNHGESGNIKLLRLAKKNAGKFIRKVHEKWEINGRVGELSSPLYHTKDRLISGFLPRMELYSSIDSPELTKENKPFSYFRLFVNPLFKFIYNYFFKRGFLDGYPGLFQAYLMSSQSLTVRVYQWTNKSSF